MTRITLSLCVTAFFACSKEEAKVGSGTLSYEVKRVSTSQLALLRTASSLTEGDGSRISFTPASVKVPIYHIAIEGLVKYAKEDKVTENEGFSSIYECEAGTDEGCTVEVTSQAALDKITGSVSVSEGTYNEIRISHFDSTSGQGPGDAKKYMQVKGTIESEGTTYYTSPTGLTDDASKYDYVLLPIKLDSEFPILTPLVIAAGAALDFSIYTNFDNIAFGDPLASTADDGNTGCLGGNICSQSPPLMGILGTESPSTEVFSIEFSGEPLTQTWGELVLVIDAADQVLGGFAHTYYDGTSTRHGADGSFAGPLTAVTKNGDGTWTLDATGPTGEGGYKIDAFQRTNHTGTFATIDNRAGIDYTATRQAF